MSDKQNEQLEPQLRHAQKKLEKAVDEACAPDVKRVNTGELIRLEESLAMASKAAKEVVSLRLKMRTDRGGEAQATTERRDPVLTDVNSAGPHRTFEAADGKQWRVFAVHPTAASSEHAALPESFRSGWLSFESGGEVRRFAPLPDRWRELSLEQLRSLCQRAETSRRPAPPEQRQKPKG